MDENTTECYQLQVTRLDDGTYHAHILSEDGQPGEGKAEHPGDAVRKAWQQVEESTRARG